MSKISWNQINFTRERIYIFIFFNSLYAFLTFWIIANYTFSSSMALIGIGAYIVSFFCNFNVIRWVTAGEFTYPENKSDGQMEHMTLMRLLFGNFVIFFSGIYSIINGQLIAQEHYGMITGWQTVIGLIIFISIYIISFFFTFVKVDAETDVMPSPNKNIIANSANIENIANNIDQKSTTKDISNQTLVNKQVARPAIKEWNVFIDLVTNSKIRTSTLSILRRTSDWINVTPPADLYEKKGSAFFQQAVIRSLGDAHDPLAVPFLIELLGKTYDLSHGKEAFHRPRWPNIGVDAASALARIGQPAAEALQKSLHSPDKLSRLYAVCGIALLRDPTLHSALVTAASQETDPVVLTYLNRTLANFERKEFIDPHSNELRLSIEAALSKIHTGEPVRLFWTIRNDGLTPLIVNIGPTKIVQQIFSVKALRDQTSIYLPPYDSDSAPGPEDLVTLATGESYRVGPFDLREFFDFKKPGPYEIQGLYRNHFPGIEYGIYAVEGRLVSEPIVIEIIAW